MAAPVRRGTTKRGAPQRRQTAKQQREDPESVEAEVVTVEIEDLANFNESINIYVYGPSGHGKTVLAGGVVRPKSKSQAVFLTTEKGVVAAKRAGSTAGIIRAPDWEHALAGVKLADEKLGPEDWLIIDSHTKMQVLYLRWLLRMRNAQNSARDLDIPAIQDHQKWQNAFMRWTDHIVDAPYNTIFVGGEMIKQDKEGEEIVLPSITGKDYAICNYIIGQMDVGMYYSVSDKASTSTEIVRRAMVQPHPDLPYWAKDRYDALGKYQDVGEKDYWAMADFIEMIREEAA